MYEQQADYDPTYADRVRAVTAADVIRAADNDILACTLAVVIVGDRKAIEASVKGLNLGPLAVVEPAEIFK
jgi:hypothetical protein